MKCNSGSVVRAGCLLLASFTFSAHAAAPVAEIGTAQAPPSAGQVRVAPAPAPSTNTYYLLQSLRDELRDLRGMVEEQGNTIRLLKQRQVDDYLDLDRRFGTLIAGGANAPAVSAGGSTSSAANTLVPVVAPDNSHDAEKAAYEKAYGVLKAGQVDAAKQAFTAYLAKYPKGRYAANGYYWLGEIYMLDNQLAEAGEAFAVVVGQYPAHRKMLDASFKLAKVYHLQGKDEKAKALLTKVAVTKGSAGKLAGDYLKANF